jgi:Ca2+-binding EF-hand superfamily protein
VAEVYQRVLERGFDSRGDNLVTQLAAGQTTVRDIVRAAARLPEFSQRFLNGDRTVAVTNLYRHLLGREPDPIGLEGHVRGAQQSGIGSVMQLMLDSPEYATNVGDYGVPGSSIRYCGPGQQASQQTSSARGNRNMRFAGLDANGNGQIERTEWNGTRESFVVHDWNGDNVLSGDEVRPGGRRSAAEEPDFNPARPGAFNSWTETTFTSIDRNRDGRVSANEWYYDTESFVRADRNRDGFLAKTEFLGADNMDDDREDTFADLDVNRNGRVERREWHASEDAFTWLDRNKDGVLSRAEVVGNGQAVDQFRTLDANNDGRLSTEEWQWSRRSFSQQDVNGDGFVSRREFTASGAVPTTGR